MPKGKQIAVYPTETLRKKIKDEAAARRRKLGPTIVEILWEYFSTKEAKNAAS